MVKFEGNDQYKRLIEFIDSTSAGIKDVLKNRSYISFVAVENDGYTIVLHERFTLVDGFWEKKIILDHTPKTKIPEPFIDDARI